MRGSWLYLKYSFKTLKVFLESSWCCRVFGGIEQNPRLCYLWEEIHRDESQLYSCRHLFLNEQLLRSGGDLPHTGQCKWEELHTWVVIKNKSCFLPIKLSLWLLSVVETLETEIRLLSIDVKAVTAVFNSTVCNSISCTRHPTPELQTPGRVILVCFYYILDILLRAAEYLLCKSTLHVRYYCSWVPQM